MALPLQADLEGLAPPPRENLQERVYRALRQALMRGHVPPGRSLTIRAVATALGTSAMPVREALRQLVAERALVMLPNRSFGTPLLTLGGFEDLKAIRMEVEGFAAGQAAARMERATLAELTRIDQAMDEAARRVERARYIGLNQDFHFTLYRAAGSAVLLPIIESLWLQAGPYLTWVFASGPRPSVGHARHKPILTALRRQDAAAARAALAADIEEAGAILRRLASFAPEPGEEIHE
jgi:DNA-binding GntR family transcriptional regulator